MLKKLKEYFTYRHNKKLAVRETAKIAAIILPTVREFSSSSSEIADFIRKLSKETKEIGGEKLMELVLREISGVLQSNHSRMIEILTYIISLSPEEIQKILVHAMVETMPD